MRPGGEAPEHTGPNGACSAKRSPFVYPREAGTTVPQPPPSGQAEPAGCQRTAAPPGLLPHHWAELQASAIAPDVAAANVASFGPGTDRHWETERAELVRHARHRIETASTTGRGLPQAQAGHLSDALARLDRRYRHLSAGGWRTLSATLPGLPVFDQWKPADPRQKGKRDPLSGEWRPQLDEHGQPVPIKYEAPPAFPDGGGLLLPNVPERCWRLICERQELPFPDAETVAAGFWPWALQTPALDLLICEGWKKALSALSHGWAAVALPGVSMGHRGSAETGRRLIAALRALASRHQRKRCDIGSGRRWLIAFDAEARPDTARKVAAAAGALAQTLRAMQARSTSRRVVIARLPLLSGTTKTGLDDLLAAQGAEALARALADTGARPALAPAPQPHRIAPAGRYLGEACPIPAPQDAPLVVAACPMGSGKTVAAREAAAPMLAEGVPVLLASHRKALGQACAETIGLPWMPRPRDDRRRQGLGSTWDSFCPDSALRISPEGWSGSVLVLDEWMQALEHLLLSHGTTLGKRRGSVLATAGEVIARARQTIALDAQLAAWGVRLLERLSGRQALVIASEARPMAGRPLHCPAGLKDAQEAAAAFRCKWWELVRSGQPFLCWVTAQRGEFRNAAQTLAEMHRATVPGARVLVIDSTTEEAAARLAADPDGEASRWDAIYATPAISSGISFATWRPAAVIAYSGGRIGPEHVAQAAARVRCPEVPVWIYAPEASPGADLRVGSGATDPADLIADLRAVSDPLLGELREQLQTAGDAWLQAWAELGALRNRQRHAYRATIAGLLEREAWALQPTGPDYDEGLAKGLAERLGILADANKDAADLALLSAEPLDPEAARELERARRRLDPDEAAALGRHRLLSRWGLLERPPLLVRDGAPTKAAAALLEADRDGLRERLRLGWLLSDPEAAGLVPEHDWQQIEALAPEGQAFGPDRLRVALAPRLFALGALGIPALLERFRAGEVIAATDPAILQLHALATAHRRKLAAALGVSPGELPTGTLRTLLEAIGWRLEKAGRIKARGADRDAYTYRAAPIALPAWLDREALIAQWRAELQAPAAARSRGAKTAPTENLCREEKSPRPWPPDRPPGVRPAWLALMRTLQPRQTARTGPPPPVMVPA